MLIHFFDHILEAIRTDCFVDELETLTYALF